MNKKTNSYLKWLYLLLYISFGVFFPYVNVYYSRIGIDGVQIGFISSISVIIAMIFIPLWGILADKFSNRKILFILTLFSAISVLFWSFQNIFWLLCLFSICIYIFKTDLASICDSLAVEYCNKLDLNFGKLRSFGSLGYIIGSTFIAGFMNYLGYNGPYVFFYILSLGLCCLILFKLPKEEIKKANSNKLKDMFKGAKDIIKDRRFIVIMLVSLFTNISVDVLTSYSGIHLTTTLNQSESIIGIGLFLMVIPELFVVNKASKIIKKIGFNKAYILSCISVVVRCLLCYLTSNIYIYLIAQTLHGVLVITAIVGNIEILNTMFGGDKLARSLTLLQTFCMIFEAILSQMFGFTLKYFGTHNLYLLGVIFAFISLVIVLMNKKVFDIKKESL